MQPACLALLRGGCCGERHLLAARRAGPARTIAQLCGPGADRGDRTASRQATRRGGRCRHAGGRAAGTPDGCGRFFTEAYKPEALAHSDALDVYRAINGDLDSIVISPAAEFHPGARTGQYRSCWTTMPNARQAEALVASQSEWGALFLGGLPTSVLCDSAQDMAVPPTTPERWLERRRERRADRGARRTTHSRSTGVSSISRRSRMKHRLRSIHGRAFER